MHPYPGLVFGGGAFLEVNGFGGLDEVKQALSYLQEEGINIIDTAANYGNSEETLGELSAAKSFLIGTKYPGEFCPKPTTKKTVRAIAEASLKKLQTDQVGCHLFFT
jgi:aryl-alcohol dehydrogenase-like predicted oxidoreductase